MSAAWGTLDLAPVGNCQVSALVDSGARFVWACVPRVDGEAIFPALLGGVDPASEDAQGLWAIDLHKQVASRQAYERNTAVLRTILTDADGAELEITDFCPRFRQHGRTYRPIAFVRVLRPLAGAPRIRIRLRAAEGFSARPAATTWGSNHIRYLTSALPLRLTTDVPVSHITEERWFRLEGTRRMFLGPDEPFQGNLAIAVRSMYDQTVAEWREWVRGLAIPLEWQEVVIRAAITLKLCQYEETGAIVAALTTSIPEAPNSGRNWDYRYCWPRDAYFTVQALNRLGALDVLEAYLSYLRNLIDQAEGGTIQPLYGVGHETKLAEEIVESLPGYRGMGPVRVGNQAHTHRQHDVYGQILLSSVQTFHDQRLLRPGGLDDFRALERVGEQAFARHAEPDAGLWEFRTRERVHTYSALMCWAGCDRLAMAATALGLPDRTRYWRARADTIRRAIETRAWSPAAGAFGSELDGDGVDASLLQMVELRFLAADDPRFLATFARVEAELRRGDHMLRYAAADDFGVPETAFNFCIFWLIEALWWVGRGAEARTLFESVIRRLPASRLLSEDSDITTGEPWGNFPQTYSLVGLINCATLLSRPWSSVR